ncbi:hypothetical protein LTS18_002974 [Coniosporium uncinatum]|uniref:Uncharacterized protein n=1 Tax=Coniosporium uncinatum TaxID=93489 RepID=A0ACC3DTU0_9PEZI|nr:hypothetical protein LTS18_002974 [Coniosporium uncinatum]
MVWAVGAGSRRGAKNINHHAHLGAASTRESVNLFAGFKKESWDPIQHIIRPASHAGILDIVELCPSNAERVRVQDRILLPHVRAKLEAKPRDPACIFFFVCANDGAAEGAAEGAVVNLSVVADGNVKKILGERYVEEIFRS